MSVGGDHDGGNGTTDHSPRDRHDLMVYEVTRMSPFSTPGHNYLKTLPLSYRGRVGELHDQAEPIGILNDVCSNITLMDYGLFKARYSKVVVYEEP